MYTRGGGRESTVYTREGERRSRGRTHWGFGCTQRKCVLDLEWAHTHNGNKADAKSHTSIPTSSLFV